MGKEMSILDPTGLAPEAKCWPVGGAVTEPKDGKAEPKMVREIYLA